jgi:CPA1 family monovalent cation:H+ antiporter
MTEVSVIELIVAQAPPLGSNPATNSQTAAAIPEWVIILIILLLIATFVALVTNGCGFPMSRA